jgi:hypothetical protein
MLFDSGSDLNVIGSHENVDAGLANDGASPLQVFVDDEADEGAQGQSHGPDHQQTRTVHSTPVNKSGDTDSSGEATRAEISAGIAPAQRDAKSY